MTASINGVLQKLSYEYYIPSDSEEGRKIDRSVYNIKNNLAFFFGTKLQRIKEFGSYKRDTILPAEFDPLSDIDLMIIFNRDYYNVLPTTYLTQLQSFADKYYGRSSVKRTSPSYTIGLEHIRYDLVPAYEEQQQIGLFPPNITLKIPNGPNAWKTTDPDSFNDNLTRVNGQHRHQVKPVIRLLKAWNAKVGYPFGGYELENKIVNSLSYLGFYRSLEQLFFDAIDDISGFAVFSAFGNPKLTSLRENARKVKEALNNNNEELAKRWLQHILPF